MLLSVWQDWHAGLWYWNNSNDTGDQVSHTHFSCSACITQPHPRHIVENDNDDTRVHLVYGCRTQHTILQKEFLDECQQFWNFSVLYTLSQCTGKTAQENKGLLKYQDKVHYGRIDMDLVKHEMPPPSPKHCILICGTKSFDKDMINYLLKLGYANSMYFKF